METLLDGTYEESSDFIQEQNFQNESRAQILIDRVRDTFGDMADHIGSIVPTPSRKLTARIAAGALALGGGALAPAAEAKIVVGQSIAGVKLGATQPEVTQLLGSPSLAQPADAEGNIEWSYARVPLMGAMSFDASGKISGMWTASKKQKTNKNIGPGSSVAQVRKAYPGAKCAAGPLGPTSLDCTLKSRYAGHVVETTFAFSSRKAGAREVDIDLS